MKIPLIGIIGLICCLAISMPATAADPNVAFGQLGQYPTGSTVMINGTTNLAAGDHLVVDVYSSSFGPTPKAGNATFYGASGIVTVRQGPGTNTWSFPVNTAGWPPDTYIVTVSGIEVETTASTTFALVPPGTSTTGTTVPATTTPSPSSTTQPQSSQTTTPPVTSTPGFGLAACIGGIAAAGVLGRIRIR